MNYPAWEVPVIGGPWVIGIISIFHVLIAWFAVGGGLYLPLAEAKLYREGRENFLPVLKQHSRFFLVLTSVFGAISGVGIWFAIGLVSPEGTSTLIHNFVFGWAIEWVFFVIELAAAAVYYLTWDRIPKELHLKVGYLYAISSFLTLVIINGILAFMLTPGAAWLNVAGTGKEASVFWLAFFNPTYFPSLIMRALACISLAGIYALISYSRVTDEALEEHRNVMVKWSAKWLMPMFVGMPLVLVWFLAATPSEHRGLLELGMTTIGSGAFTQVTRIAMLTILTTFTVAGVVYFLAYKGAKYMTFSHAFSVLFLAAIATASTEFARETLRKPFVIGSHMYSNGVRKSEVVQFNSVGYLARSPWAPKEDNPIKRGQIMYRGQCMACHTESGYRGIRKMLQGRDYANVRKMLDLLHKMPDDSPYRKYMPPLVGTDSEVNDLALYLSTLSTPMETPLTAQTEATTVAKSK